MKRILLWSLLSGITGLPRPHATACSTILAGQRATADGSVMMSHSCDGDVMGLVCVMPAHTYAPGTRLPMYWNVPRPSTYEEYRANLRKGYDQVGTLPVSETCRSLILAGNLESMTTGGLNEYGVSIAIEFLPAGSKDVHAMIHPAEQRYIDLQPDLERSAVEIFRKRGPAAAEVFLTNYASDCATQVGTAYAELIDYLLLRFLVGDPEFARPALPRIGAPTVPQVVLQETP